MLTCLEGFASEIGFFQPVYFIASFFRIRKEDEVTVVTEIVSPKSFGTETSASSSMHGGRYEK
jgi:hypothetical protein